MSTECGLNSGFVFEGKTVKITVGLLDIFYVLDQHFPRRFSQEIIEYMNILEYRGKYQILFKISQALLPSSWHR
jgi:hypothetical protein